ncbi:MAG: LppM family (lipo)protein [Actinomycetes bacterium]
MAQLASSQRLRRSASLSMLVVATAVLLSACFKLDMQIELQSDDTVDGSIILAVARDQAQLLGGEDALRQSLQSQEGGIFSDAPEQGTFEQRDYEDADWIGTESVFSGVPIDEFGSGDTGDLSITRDGDEFVVEGSMDLSSDTQDTTTQSLLDSADLQISITFPGGVTETNGHVDGNTVTWQPKAGEVLDISARGSAVSGTNWALISAIAALVALVVIGVVLLIVVRRREVDPGGAPSAVDVAPGSDAGADAEPTS